MSAHETEPPGRTTAATTELAADDTDLTTELVPPSRRSLIAAGGASALAAGLVGGSAAPATALSPPATAPAAPAAPPPSVSEERYRTVARAVVVHDENDKPLVPAYLKAVKNGLPGRAARRKRVLVVGSGPAGMLAARLLKDAGHDVVVIEANDNRVGGRIKTFRRGGHEGGEQPFADPRQYAEAGAMRLPGSHPLLMALLDKYRLPKQEFYLVDVDPDDPSTKTNRAWIHVNGVRMRRADYEKNPAKINGTYGVTGPHRTMTASAVLKEALSPARRLVDDKEGKPLVDGWVEVLKRYGHMSMYRYLTEVAGLDTATVDLVGTIQNLTSRLHLAFLHSFLSAALIAPETTFWEIPGGPRSSPTRCANP